MTSIRIGSIVLNPLTREGRAVRASIESQTQNEFEQSLRELVESLPVFKDQFAAGGPLQIPDWFVKQCRSEGIRIEIDTSNTVNVMGTENTLKKRYDGRIKCPKTVEDLPRGKYLVYVLTCGDKAIIVGQGKKNRAQVIFDSLEKDRITPHIKAIFVRLHLLFAKCTRFYRYIIECNDKDEAKRIENDVHDIIGGNTRDIADFISARLFEGIRPDCLAYMVIKMALLSSYDGISDLNKWRREGLLNDEVWCTIATRLRLKDPLRAIARRRVGSRA